jgi:hypothetical protein
MDTVSICWCLLSGTSESLFGYLLPGTWYQVLGATRYLVRGTWCLVPGAWYPVPGTSYLVLGTSPHAPEHVSGRSERPVRVFNTASR